MGLFDIVHLIFVAEPHNIFRSSPLPYITNEVRYRMRNIPFFVLPPCESKAYDPSRVKAKVDTRNTGYVQYISMESLTSGSLYKVQKVVQIYHGKCIFDFLQYQSEIA